MEDLGNIYSDMTRRRVNGYCYKHDLLIYGFLEYIKSFFPKLFPQDKINKQFYRKYIFIEREPSASKIMPIENCLVIISRSARNLLAESGSLYRYKDRITMDFKSQFLFTYEFLSRVKTKKDISDIFDEFDRVSRRIATKGYLEAVDLLGLVKLLYRMIILYEPSVKKIDAILKEAKTVCLKYASNKDEKYQIEKDAIDFKNAFISLFVSYKREMFPLVLKYIDSYCDDEENENTPSEPRNATIKAFLEIKPSEILSLENFLAEQEKIRAMLEEARKNKVEEQDILTQRLKESIVFIDMLYPESLFRNVLDFEFVLPYFVSSLIKEEQINIDIQELEIISRNDPVQILLVIFSIIWYNFLTIFDIEDDIVEINELGTIKTKWEKFFGNFKSYFESLLNYYKEIKTQRQEISGRILYEAKSKIIYRKKPTSSETLFDIVNDLLEFLYKIETNQIKFFMRSGLKAAGKLGKDDTINIFSNYKRLVEVLKYLLSDRASFLLQDIDSVKFATITESEILKKYKLL